MVKSVLSSTGEPHGNFYILSSRSTPVFDRGNLGDSRDVGGAASPPMGRSERSSDCARALDSDRRLVWRALGLSFEHNAEFYRRLQFPYPSNPFISAYLTRLLTPSRNPLAPSRHVLLV